MHQLTHNKTRDCSLNSPKNTSSEHGMYNNRETKAVWMKMPQKAKITRRFGLHETYVALLNVVQVPQAPKNKGRLRSRLNLCSKSGSGQLLKEANFWPKLEENTEFCSWLFVWSVSFSRRNLERWDRNPDISDDFIFHIFFPIFF